MRSCLWILVAGLAQAQYFPLQVGNQWVYRVDKGPVKEVRVAEILRSEIIGDAEYFVYRGLFGGIARLRLTVENKLVQWNPSGAESLWADFDAAEGAIYVQGFDDCTGRGRIESRTAKVELADGTRENGLQVSYGTGACADAGVSEDIYLPSLGLAQRTIQSFTGPRLYKLTYARIGNTSITTTGEYGFRLSLSQHTLAPRALINLRLTLENTTKEPIKLQFSSGQTFDFAIRDSSGETIYFWSANKLFVAEMSELSIIGEKNWTVADELDLRPGEYVLEAWLTTGPKPQFKAQVPFTVAAN